MRNLVVVPARYNSTRLAGKPLINISGKPMIQRVVENIRLSKQVEKLIVATDDKRIYDTVKSFDGDVVMTSPDHTTGSDRVAEVAAMFDCDFVVNVQGDEPRIPPELIDEIFLALHAGSKVVTASRPLRDAGELQEPSRVKLITNSAGDAMLFSRAPIPFAREESESEMAVDMARIHIGLYGFHKDVLLAFPRMEKPLLEQVERLEQLRLLHAGIQIRVIPGRDFGDSIDTIEDLESYISFLNSR